MIHKIKALYDNGNGSSMRAIGTKLGISRNTVRKYLRTDEVTIAEQQNNPERVKRLDKCRDFIIHLLQTYPKLSAVKVLRKLRQQYPALTASDRTVRRYLQALKQTVTIKQQRYYEPVLDMVPGVQCQVDPGELRNVLINGIASTIHFVVFVLSFSRLMYVALAREPIDTKRFVQMHDEAFQYFGGCPQECVYDQTKLVVLHEQYRELDINPQFLQYATTAGFKIKACEGYDPESKVLNCTEY
jgi:transposase